MDNAMTNIDAQMKAAFRWVFPEYAVRMEAAKSDEDLILTHKELVAACRENLNSAIALAGGGQIGIGAAQKDVPLLLTPELQKALSAARLDKVKTRILDLVKSLVEISKLKEPPPEMLASALISAGCVTALWPTPQAVLAIGQMCSSSSSEALLSSHLATTFSSGAAAGAASAGISVMVVIAAIVLVVAIVSIIFIAVLSSRKCVILFVNELDEPVTFKGAHFDHGDKDSLSYSESIPEAIVNPDLGVFPWAGFVIADKNIGLYGTQFGFSYKYGACSLSVGALCGLKNPNQCWCAIDNSAARVSEKLFDAKKLSHEAVKGNLKLTVNCNSHSGSPAFFIARAHSG